MAKYRAHFGELPSFYNEVINLFKQSLSKVSDLTIANLAERLKVRALVDTAQQKGITMSEGFKAHLDKYWFRFADKREHFVVKYFSDVGYFQIGSCERCGEEVNSKAHVTNDCEGHDDHRASHRERLEDVLGGEYMERKNMLELLYGVFFTPVGNLTMKQHRSIVEIVKSFITGLWYRDVHDE